MTHTREKILQIVEKSGVTMIPRWKFVMYSILGVIGLVFAFLALVFVTSLALFLLSKYGFLYLPFFDAGAVIHGLVAIPGLLLFLGIALVIIVEILSRHYAFTFKKPLLVTVGGIVVCAVGVGYVVSLTSFHEMVRDATRNSTLGGSMRHMYDRPLAFKGEKGLTVIRGTVVATTTESFSVESFDEDVTLIFASSTSIRVAIPRVGDDVLVFGKVNDGVFELVGMRPVPSFERHLPHDDKRKGIGTRIEMMERNMMMK
jgi:hypothetical protein